MSTPAYPFEENLPSSTCEPGPAQDEILSYVSKCPPLQVQFRGFTRIVSRRSPSILKCALCNGNGGRHCQALKIHEEDDLVYYNTRLFSVKNMSYVET